MSKEKMVAPKFQAVALIEYRQEIEEAVFEIGRLTPNHDKIMLLINLFNKVHNSNVFTYNKYAGCGDCQRNLKKFWIYVIKEWKKQ